MEIFLNRWRGTGTMIYAFYMFVLVSILSNPIYGFIATLLFLVGESLAFGKWVGYLTYPENYDKEQFENNKAGSKFPFIHQTANFLIKQSNPYKYSLLALSIRGLYWWLPLYLLFTYIGLINYYEAVIIGIFLGISFPIACILSRKFTFRFDYKYLKCTDNWHRQELIYGLFHGLGMGYITLKVFYGI